MVEENKELKIECLSEFPNYGKVAFLIRIIDGTAVTKYSDARLAKDTYLLEKKMGNQNISFQERLSCTIEKFPGQTKEQIAENIIKILKQHNATFKR